MPNACAAIPIRPPSRVASAILNPSPSLPSRFPTGTFTLLKKSVQVEEARIPIVCSLFPLVSPALSASTRIALIPLWPAAGSVFA